MAAGNGHVYNIEYTREYHTNIDTASARPLDTAGIRPGIQLDMRKSDFRRALHEVVIMGDMFSLRRCGADRNIWGDSFAYSYTR